MTIKTDRRSLAMALVNAEDLTKNHLDLISSQLGLIYLAIKDGTHLNQAMGGISLLEIYVDDMYSLAEKLSAKANEIWEVVSKEEA